MRESRRLPRGVVFSRTPGKSRSPEVFAGMNRRRRTKGTPESDRTGVHHGPIWSDRQSSVHKYIMSIINGQQSLRDRSFNRLRGELRS